MREEALIHAPTARAWEVATNFGDWPRWAPSGLQMTLANTPPVVGGKLDVINQGSRLSAEIVEWDPPRQVTWGGTHLGTYHQYSLEISTDGTGSHVAMELALSGGLYPLIPRWIMALQGRPPGVPERATLRALLSALKAEAERNFP